MNVKPELLAAAEAIAKTDSEVDDILAELVEEGICLTCGDYSADCNH